MSTITPPASARPASREDAPAPWCQVPRRIALLGNPNTGKTTLFNRLSGLRHKTSNFPGTTLESRLGRVRIDGMIVRGQARSCCCGQDGSESAAGAPVAAAAPPCDLELIDLPGVYSLELEQLEAGMCREVLAGQAAPRGEPVRAPDAACVVLDAMNLARNLMLVGEVLRRRLPTVVAVNMIDLAHRRGLVIDTAKMAAALGCRVVCTSARTGEGLDDLRAALADPHIPSHTPPGGEEGDESALRIWADHIYSVSVTASDHRAAADDRLTDRLDRAFTHPVLGVMVFALVMGGLFWAIFSLARFPMDAIQWLFAQFGGLIEGHLGPGLVRDFLAKGVVGGVSATIVFLPQICLLFFLISLLEDTGYLARAAFVVDRVLRPFGLPGHSFVPLLSSHACALPGIMATRSIPDRRERLATILVAPFMTCSARLPVYVLLTTVLFPTDPAHPWSNWRAPAAFVGCYALGIFAGIASALIARRTILRGPARPMALELPTYKLPSVQTALVTTYDRGLVFVKNAGTNILMICIALWWLSNFPHVAPPPRAVELRQQAEFYRGAAEAPAPLDTGAASAGAPGEARIEGELVGAPLSPAQLRDRADNLQAQADRLEASNAISHSFAGRLGRSIEPVLRPLGYDWHLTIGVLTSFAAREVFVSTMSIVVTGEKDQNRAGVLDAIAAAKRDDGVTPIFTPAVSWSLLVYYVLAMQCLPTLAVTARESGSVKWALLQLVWMSGMAYVAALVVYQVMA